MAFIAFMHITVKLFFDEMMILFCFVLDQQTELAFYPLANEVAKGYSNATVSPSFRIILVNTLVSRINILQ